MKAPDSTLRAPERASRPSRQYAGVSHEPSVLTAPQLQQWQGLRLGIFEALSHEIRAPIEGPHAVVAMILKGRTHAELRARGQHCELSPEPDSIGLFGPVLDINYCRWVCEPGAERLMIELDFALLQADDSLHALSGTKGVLRQDLTLRDPQLAALLRLIAEEARSGSPHGQLYAGALSLSLAAYLFAHHADRAPSVRERGGLSASQEARVLALMREHLADDLGLADLADAAGVSRFHFVRLFRNRFGTTPYRYLLEQRVAEARRLVQDGALSLAEVAVATGFSSQSHLSSAMRRHTGLSPRQWRRGSPR